MPVDALKLTTSAHQELAVGPSPSQVERVWQQVWPSSTVTPTTTTTTPAAHEHAYPLLSPYRIHPRIALLNCRQRRGLAPLGDRKGLQEPRGLSDDHSAPWNDATATMTSLRDRRATPISSTMTTRLIPMRTTLCPLCRMDSGRLMLPARDGTATDTTMTGTMHHSDTPPPRRHLIPTSAAWQPGTAR